LIHLRPQLQKVLNLLHILFVLICKQKYIGQIYRGNIIKLGVLRQLPYDLFVDLSGLEIVMEFIKAEGYLQPNFSF
jgi:hypothetical protein